MKNEIMVSVIMPVYNHENYLEKAIQSVMEQKVEFGIELLIGEDCSKDSSAQICRNYEKQYPESIKVFYRESNMGALENSYNLATQTVGKYIICLEGDDFWCDEYKLKKQVEFLERHKEYIACCHHFKVVNREGQQYYDRDFECQFFEGNVYTVNEFENGYLASHINTILYRNIFKDDKIETEFIHLFENVLGDITMTALLVNNGKIYCLDEVMSCYRKVIAKDSSSFNSQSERKNMRTQVFRDQMYLEEHFDKKISFHKRKKAVFASAVFKWYRERTSENYKVVQDIIDSSGEKIKYRLYFGYLFIAKKIVSLIFKEDRRIKF